MVISPTMYQLWYGRDEAPFPSHTLRAGVVTARLVGRDLRNLRFGGVEIAQRIYVAIRDRNWGTVPGEVTNVAIDDQADHFRVAFDVHHRQHDVDFGWRGEITGTAEGVISFAMNGLANTDMTYKLIGFNVHHGMREFVGRPYQAQTADGPVGGVFPTLVEPQLVVDQTEVPIFPPVSSVTVQLTNDTGVRFDFEGDTFEFEDQRNWTDASFKSQSYPPRRNGFYRSRQGDHLVQRVTVTPIGILSPAPARGDHVQLAIESAPGRPLPAIGLGMASHGTPLSNRETTLLRMLRPDHLRVDLRLAGATVEQDLTHGVETARTLDCPLELALFVTDDAGRQLATVAALLGRERPAVVRVLVFHEAEQATAERWVEIARQELDSVVPGAMFAGGANGNFCELNRHRPHRAPEDGIVYSINPQIHSFDELSLVENLAGQAETVVTARQFGAGRPVIVSPVTFRQRFNAVATSDEPALALGALPPQVDPRQMSLFGAGWTIGSVKYLAESGATAVTYFETTGWGGVIDTDAGSPLPEHFPSRPGMVFPMYHVFADVAEWRGGEVIQVQSSDPLAVDGLVIQYSGVRHLLIANLTAERQQATIGPLAAGHATVRRLNSGTAHAALFEPERFRAETNRELITDEHLALALSPYETVRIDALRSR